VGIFTAQPFRRCGSVISQKGFLHTFEKHFMKDIRQLYTLTPPPKQLAFAYCFENWAIEVLGAVGAEYWLLAAIVVSA